MEDKNFNTEEYCLLFACAHLVIIARFMQQKKEDRRINFFDHQWEKNLIVAQGTIVHDWFYDDREHNMTIEYE